MVQNENDEEITLCSALFQAAVLLEAIFPVGSCERTIAVICAQAAIALEESAREIFELKSRLEANENYPRGSADQATADQSPAAALLPR